MRQLNWQNLDIVVVEDSPTQALLLQRDLELKGAKVRLAKDGLEGLEAVRTKTPALIVSDIKMPKMDGYEMCRLIKTEKHVPVILLTILSDPLDVIKGLECGADYFLTKPCQPDLLYSYVESSLTNEEFKREQPPKQEVQFTVEGQQYTIKSNPVQIFNLLLSTYSSAIQKNKELTEANHQLNIAHQQLKENNDYLAKINAEKNQLLGMAAHDLRNPLGVIMGFSGILLERLSDKIDEKSKKILLHIKNSTSLMLSIINDLLDISSIESGKVQLDMHPQDLVSLLDNNVTLNQEIANKKHIQISCQHDSNIPLVLSDKNKIEQVFDNLISNAIKYSNPDTNIQISLKKSANNEVILAVKDQGQGIPTEQQSRLFQPFSKTSVKTTAGETSTGLGLAIVKKIIEAHKGKIWVESEVGKGSTFYVQLPIHSPT